jgi:hypothetical protein
MDLQRSGSITEADFKVFTDALAAVLAKKNADYGNGVFDFGRMGIVIRLNDKMRRLISLVNKNEVNFESIADTLVDIAGYAVLGMIQEYSCGHKILDVKL